MEWKWWAQTPLNRRLEAVVKAVGGGYCRAIEMPLKPALAVREAVAGRMLGAWRGGGAPLLVHPCTVPSPPHTHCPPPPPHTHSPALPSISLSPTGPCPPPSTAPSPMHTPPDAQPLPYPICVTRKPKRPPEERLVPGMMLLY